MKTALYKRKFLNTGALAISYFKLIPDLFRLNKSSLVFDCGANVGHISKLLGSTGATIIAFEPDPLAFSKLTDRCGKKENITLIQKGVWDKNAEIQLYQHIDADKRNASFTVGSSIMADKINISTQKYHSAEVIDLIEFMRVQTQKIDLIKMDIEGAEIEILYKIIETESWNLFSRMYVETHETKIIAHVKELENIKQLLKEKGITNIKLNWI